MGPILHAYCTLVSTVKRLEDFSPEGCRYDHSFVKHYHSIHHRKSVFVLQEREDFRRHGLTAVREASLDKSNKVLNSAVHTALTTHILPGYSTRLLCICACGGNNFSFHIIYNLSFKVVYPYNSKSVSMIRRCWVTASSISCTVYSTGYIYNVKHPHQSLLFEPEQSIIP